MKTVTKLLLLSLIVLTFQNCDKDDDAVLRNDNILKLEVGQKMRYILHTGEGYSDPNNIDFTYTSDTLELEVLDFDNNTYLISEKITSLSNMKLNDVNYYWENKDSTYVNSWIIRNDSIAFESNSLNFKSHLIANFYPAFYHNSNLSLNEFEEETQITGWKTSFPYSESNTELFTKNYTQLGNNYDMLNVYINNELMSTDGPGFTTIYSREHGIVRSSRYSWWTGTGYGWDRLD